MDKLIMEAKPTKPETATVLIGRVEREFLSMGSRFTLQGFPEAAEIQETTGWFFETKAATQQAVDLLKEASISMTCTWEHLASIKERREKAGAPEGVGLDWLISDAVASQTVIDEAMAMLVGDVWPNDQADPGVDLERDLAPPAAPAGTTIVKI